MSDQFNVFVTGGAGFIGSNLVRHLCSVDRVDNVVVLDNLSGGSSNNVVYSPKVRFINGDIRDSNVLNVALKDINVVFHLAGDTWVQREVKDPDSYFETNVQSSLKVIEAARHSGVQRFVFASSCAVYGNQTRMPISENTSVAPLSPYASNKAAAEALFESYFQSYHMECVVLRLFNVYGAGQIHNGSYAGMIAQFIKAAKQQQTITIHGTGKQTRDYVHIDDVIQAFRRAGLDYDGCSTRRVFNIGTGVETSLLEVASIVREVTGCVVPLQFVPAREGEIERSVSDNSNSASMLGYHPSVSLHDGIEELWRSDVFCHPRDRIQSPLGSGKPSARPHEGLHNITDR